MKEGELIAYARKMALRSPVRRFQTGAVIFNNGQVISSGWSHSTDRTMACYRSMHAEHHAISRCSGSELIGATIVVVTVSRKSGNMTDATPCAFCMQYIQRVGIKEILMTTTGGGCRHFYTDTIDRESIVQSCKDMMNAGKKKAYLVL